MARNAGTPEGVGRREFVAGAGVFLTGTVSTIVSCAASVAENAEESVCRVLLHDAARCAGCGTCTMMCSLHHEGEVGPALSRSGIVRDPFTYEFVFNVCRQCSYPECYFACPLRDRARLMDRRTGIVHVDEDECIGCGSCIASCRYDPPRTTMHPEKRVALNCDRCMDRDEGPICVEYCTMNALTCSSQRWPEAPGRRGGSARRRAPG